jgi:hypothetical protein
MEIDEPDSMTNHTALRMAILAALMLPLSSCASSRHVAFEERDFQRASGSGSGKVTGQLKTSLASLVGTGRKDPTLVGAIADIVLMPANGYTDEVIEREYVKGEKMPADPRFAQYVHTTRADGQGNFSFTQLPPGHFYVGSEVHWSSQYWRPDKEDNMQKMEVYHTLMVYAQVQVTNGETSTVTQWNSGYDKTVENPAE